MTESIINREDMLRFIEELISEAGESGIAKEELEKALTEFEDWHISAALLDLWRQRRVRLGWNSTEQDLKIIGQPAEAQS